MAHMTNPLATVDQLDRRNSFGRLPADLLDTVFFATQCLTQAAGILLRLPQSVTAQANVVLARYWLVESPLSDEFSDVSAAVLFAVAKLSTHPTPARDIYNVYAYLNSPSSPLLRSSGSSNNNNNNNNNNNKSPPPPPDDAAQHPVSEQAYAAWQGRVLGLEGRVQGALSFDTHVALPHGLAVTYLQALDFLGQAREPLARRVVAALNTALLSPQLLYLTHQPAPLAVAAIYSAARDLAAPMPRCPWWEAFDVDREELGFLVVAMRSVEAWAAARDPDRLGLATEGMITRADVTRAMRRRGLRVGNGGGGGGGGGGDVGGRGGTDGSGDEEAAMMRAMDEQVSGMTDA